MISVQVDRRLPPLSVDRLAPLGATATAITSSMIGIPLSDSATLFEQFQKGYVLHVATAKQVFSFNLTSTSKLLPMLLECARNRGRAVVATTNPFASGSEKPTSLDREVNGAEATAYAANLLSAAGMKEFKFLTPAEFPALRGDARWVSAGTVGTLTVLSRATPEILEDLAAYLIGRDAKSCKGAFLSGAMPAEAGAIAHVFTTCRTADGKPTVGYYLAVPRKAGGAYLISNVSIESEEPAKKVDAKFTEAVLNMDAK